VTTRRQWLVGGVGAAGVLAGLGGALWREQTDTSLDASLWALQFPTPAGGTLSLADYRGHRLLINFWATWCPPCIRELPLLDEFQRQQRSAGWLVVGLAIDGPTPVREFLTRMPLGFPVGLAGLDGASLSRNLGNPTGGLPFSVVIDPAGRLREKQLGELTDAVLARWVSALT
jgi:thiol-disulfide isomerase/thioredoxin